MKASLTNYYDMRFLRRILNVLAPKRQQQQRTGKHRRRLRNLLERLLHL